MFSRKTSSTQKIALGKRLGLKQGDALVVVDVQNDFLSGGSLAVENGDQIIAPLNAYMAAFDARHLPIFLTRDWHPENHRSFQTEGGHWPIHCVKGTSGAQWPVELRVPVSTHVISKATERQIEAYSGFSGTSLAALLHDLKVRRLFIGGLATDYCVRATDARALGFDVVVLGDAIRAVNVHIGDESRVIKEMLDRGACVLERSSPAV